MTAADGPGPRAHESGNDSGNVLVVRFAPVGPQGEMKLIGRQKEDNCEINLSGHINVCSCVFNKTLLSNLEV